MYHRLQLAKTTLRSTAPTGLFGRFLFWVCVFLHLVIAPFSLFANVLILITDLPAFVEGLAPFHRQKGSIHIKRRDQLMFSFDIRFFDKRFCLFHSPIPLERKPLLFSSLFPGTADNCSFPPLKPANL